MFQIVTNLLLHGQLLLEKGKIALLGQRAFLQPAYVMADIQRKTEEKGLTNLVYKSCKLKGVIWFENMYKSFKINKEDVLTWGLNILNLAGYGEITLLSMDKEKKIMLFSLKDSPFALELKGTEAVDQMVRGFAAASGVLVFNEDCDCVEAKCVAEGAPICEFIVKPSTSFDKTVPRVKSQLL